MFIFGAMFGLGILIPTAQAMDFPAVMEECADGTFINWTEMRLESVAQGQTGFSAKGYEKQEIRAMTVANENLQRNLVNLNIDAKTSYNDLLNRNDEISKYITSNVIRYDVAETIYNSDKSVETTVYIDIHTLLRPYILERAEYEQKKPPRPKEYTGIIIDARQIDFDPVLFPTIDTKDIPEWLSVAGFSDYSAKTNLPFLYATDAANPLALNKVGRNPAFVVATASKYDHLIVDVGSLQLTDDDRSSIMGYGSVVILLQSPN